MAQRAGGSPSGGYGRIHPDVSAAIRKYSDKTITQEDRSGWYKQWQDLTTQVNRLFATKSDKTFLAQAPQIPPLLHSLRVLALSGKLIYKIGDYTQRFAEEERALHYTITNMTMRVAKLNRRGGSAATPPGGQPAQVDEIAGEEKASPENLSMTDTFMDAVKVTIATGVVVKAVSSAARICREVREALSIPTELSNHQAAEYAFKLSRGELGESAPLDEVLERTQEILDRNGRDVQIRAARDDGRELAEYVRLREERKAAERAAVEAARRADDLKREMERRVQEEAKRAAERSGS